MKGPTVFSQKDTFDRVMFTNGSNG